MIIAIFEHQDFDGKYYTVERKFLFLWFQVSPSIFFSFSNAEKWLNKYLGGEAYSKVDISSKIIVQFDLL